MGKWFSCIRLFPAAQTDLMGSMWPNWRDYQEKVDWGVVWLYAGAIIFGRVLDETGAAQLFLDGSGHGNHGTCSGELCPRAGVWSPRGKAAEFDGEQNALTTPVYLDQSSSSPGATATIS